MYDTIFYIFFIIVIAGALVAAFSASIVKSAFALLFALIAVCGLYVLLIAELFAMTNILILIFIAAFLLILSPRLKEITADEAIIYSGRHFSFVIAISLLTAAVSGLVSTTRWVIFPVDYTVNSYSMIFTYYIPLVFAVIMIFFISVVTLGFYGKKVHH